MHEGNRTGDHPGNGFRLRMPDCGKCSFTKDLEGLWETIRFSLFLPHRDPAKTFVFPMVFGWFLFLIHFFFISATPL